MPVELCPNCHVLINRLVAEKKTLDAVRAKLLTLRTASGQMNLGLKRLSSERNHLLGVLNKFKSGEYTLEQVRQEVPASFVPEVIPE